MSDNQSVTTILCVLIITIGTTISLFNLKEERLEKAYIEQGYQQVLVGSTHLWQKVKQPDAELVK